MNFELNFIEVFNPLTLYVNNCLCDLFLFVQKVNKIIVCEVHVNAIVIINVLFCMFYMLHHWHTLYDVHQKKWQGNSIRDMNLVITHDISMSEKLHGSFEIIVYL